MIISQRTVYESAPAVVAVPSEVQQRRVAVIILALDEQPSNGKTTAVDELGWPVGFFQDTFCSIPDLPERENQGEYEHREELEACAVSPVFHSHAALSSDSGTRGNCPNSDEGTFFFDKCR